MPTKTITVPLKVVTLSNMDSNGNITDTHVVAKTSYLEIYKQLIDDAILMPLPGANLTTTTEDEYFTYLDGILYRLAHWDIVEYTTADATYNG